ncbi:zf-CHY-domain-containing protein [Hortaea werneckii]|nr:zf-CHY-domain-containing protein [Hortaea werneckii]KAI7488379.1 zf-CHY-domain-containing protein [Hortaea werneckii]
MPPSTQRPRQRQQRQRDHGTSFSDLSYTTESPVEERDGGDAFHELADRSHPPPSPSGFRRRAPGPGSYSSHRPWISIPDDRISSNPARETADSLSSGSTRSFEGSAQSAADSPAGWTGAYTGRVPDSAGMAASRGEEMHNGANGGDKVDRALPDDDGMRTLREKLHEIRSLAISTEDKARKMHYLMTQDYLAHRAHYTNASAHEAESLPHSPDLVPPKDPANPYNIRPGDLEPTYSPLPVYPNDINGDDEGRPEDDPSPLLGCAHYKRNVKVQCFDCKRWFSCRHCHDQATDLPFPHQLNRKKTRNMLCMLCKTPQPAGETCVNCEEYAAWYYCPKCKLWDNDSNKRIYHCDDCGICRVGEGLGKDYVHCRRCNVCISISTSASHPCVERATEGNCPLCLVYLFESPTPVVSLPCGHYMHGECYKDLMAVTYKCPVCSKSAVNMELQWRKLDDEIRAQPMPEDDSELEGLMPHIEDAAQNEQDHTNDQTAPRRPREVYAGCNDCGRRSWTPFHWLGLKCQVCDSYNTNQMPPTAVQETEAERLIRQQQHHHRQHDFTGDSVLRAAGIGPDRALSVNSTLEVPHSPAQGPIEIPPDPERRASGAQSPRGRYFVQEDSQRRPSFSVPRFSAPSIPTLANLPEVPRLPRMPNLPNLPNLPHVRNMPNLELPRFSPAEMLDAVSRSLSPMRYYLQGLDMNEEEEGGGRGFQRQQRRSGTAMRNFSPTSIRSDPTADASSAMRRASETDEEGNVRGFWAGSSDGVVLSGDDDEDESEDDNTDDSVHAVRQDDDDDETSSSESEVSDTEMADEQDDGDDEDEMALFGHR